MATSGTFDFNLFTGEIIQIALETLQVVGDGQVATPEQVESARKMLNMMSLNWRAEDIFLWELNWITVPLIPSNIVQGSDGTDYEAIQTHTSSSVNEPITGAEYSSHWRSLGTTSGSPLWADSTSYIASNQVLLDKSIVDIENARLRDISGQTTIPMTKITQLEWFRQSFPQSVGRPTQFYFRRDFTPEILLNPIPDDTSLYVIEMFVYQYNQDFANSSDDPDFLKEWLLPLAYGLAGLIGPSYGILGPDLSQIRSMAKEFKETAMKLDHETGSLRIQPDLTRKVTGR